MDEGSSLASVLGRDSVGEDPLGGSKIIIKMM